MLVLIKRTVSCPLNHRLVTFSSYNNQTKKVIFLMNTSVNNLQQRWTFGISCIWKESHNIGPLLYLSHFCINMFKQIWIIACNTKHFVFTSTMHRQMFSHSYLIPNGSFSFCACILFTQDSLRQWIRVSQTATRKLLILLLMKISCKYTYRAYVHSTMVRM